MQQEWSNMQTMSVLTPDSIAQAAQHMYWFGFMAWPGERTDQSCLERCTPAQPQLQDRALTLWCCMLYKGQLTTFIRCHLWCFWL